jgi:tRNA/tmRNA/rRNA uracil-C5-methylase (TrmA/RlmC/RlmD family)
MLALIADFAEIDKDTVLFDICCGTGAIGLCMSKNAKKVIGVDIVAAAIENANQNVIMNQESLEKDKIKFYAGKAEEVLPNVVNEESQMRTNENG